MQLRLLFLVRYSKHTLLHIAIKPGQNAQGCNPQILLSEQQEADWTGRPESKTLWDR
jgi:hypothetical protein